MAGYVRGELKAVKVTQTASQTVVKGNFVKFDGFVGMAMQSQVTGIGETADLILLIDPATSFEITQLHAGDTGAKGTLLYWDDTAKEFTETAAGNEPIAIVVTAKDGDGVLEIKLAEQGQATAINANKTNLAALIADLAAVTHGDGASMIGEEDAGTLYTGADVEACLAEIAGAGRTTETVMGNATDLATLITDLASVATGDGASLIGVEDATGLYTGADVEACLAEIAGAGRTTETVAQNATDIAAVITDLASVATGDGASMVGVEDATGLYTGADVEACLAEIAGAGRTTETVMGNATDLAGLITDLASVATGDGASLIGVEDANGRYTGADVEACLDEIAGAGRTTETVMQNATDIGTNLADIGDIQEYLYNHVLEGVITVPTTGSTHADGGAFDFNVNISHIVAVVEGVNDELVAAVDFDVQNGGASPIDGTDTDIIYAIVLYDTAPGWAIQSVAGAAAPAGGVTPPADADITTAVGTANWIKLAHTQLHRSGAAACTQTYDNTVRPVLA